MFLFNFDGATERGCYALAQGPATGVMMQRALLLLCVLLWSWHAGAAPDAAWRAYRLAHAQAAQCPAEVRVEIWTSFLARYPHSTYQESAEREQRAALQGASVEGWAAAALEEPRCRALPAPVEAPPVVRAVRKPVHGILLSLGSSLVVSTVASGLVIQGVIDSDRERVALGLGTALAGGAVTPGLGLLYTGDTERFWNGVGIRAISATAVAGGMLLLTGGFSEREPSALGRPLGAGLLVGGIIAGNISSRVDMIRTFKSLGKRRASVAPQP